MNDKQLQSLIGMALEAEELSGEAPLAGSLHAAGSTPRSHRRWYVGVPGAGLLAAVVLLAVGISIYMRTGSAPSPNPGAVAIVNPSDVAPEPAPTPAPAPTPVRANTVTVAQNPVPAEQGCPDKSVVLAIYEDAPGVIRCVRWREHNWKDGRCLHEVNPAELLCAGFGAPCNQAGATRPNTLLVVALSGPKDRLPSNEGEAQALATCIAHSPLAHDDPDRDPACVHVPCIPPDVTVRVESLAMGR